MLIYFKKKVADPLNDFIFALNLFNLKLINMKKTILMLAMSAMTLGAFAQEIKSSKGENYLPEAGDWALGFNANGVFEYVGRAFTSGNNAPSLTSQINNTFVGKKFTSDKEAYRVVANLRAGSNSSTVGATETTTSGFGLTAGLGKEWRKGKTRLQGFYGADALVFLNTGSTKATTGNVVTTTTPGLQLGLGVNGFVGAEYFIFPKMSLGAQFSYGLQVSVTGKDKFESGGTTVESGGSSSFGLSGVSVQSINLNLHF